MSIWLLIGSNDLLMGKLISQGASRSEVVGAARLEGGSDSQIEEVKVTTLCRKTIKNDLIMLLDWVYIILFFKLIFLTGKRNCSECEARCWARKWVADWKFN